MVVGRFNASASLRQDGGAKLNDRQMAEKVDMDAVRMRHIEQCRDQLVQWSREHFAKVQRAADEGGPLPEDWSAPPAAVDAYRCVLAHLEELEVRTNMFDDTP